MNILAFYPSLNFDRDAIAQVPLHVSSKGHNVLVVGSGKVNSLKGKYNLPLWQEHGSLRLYRPFNSHGEMRNPSKKRLQEVLVGIGDFQPDLIFCSGEFNLKTATFFKKFFRAPLVLLMESLSADRIIYPRLKGYNILRKARCNHLFRFLRALYLKRIVQMADYLLYVEYNAEQAILEHLERQGLQSRYVPWCAKTRPNTIAKETNTGVYVGSLHDFKNAKEFLTTLPIIMEQTKTRKFTIVGPGPYADAIRNLTQKYPGRLVYKESLPIEEAETLIAASHYGYTPVMQGGLGFINDCWALRTPLVATHDINGYLSHGADALIADSPTTMATVVNALLENSLLCQKLQATAFERHASNNSPEKIGDTYIEVFQEVLAKSLRSGC